MEPPPPSATVLHIESFNQIRKGTVDRDEGYKSEGGQLYERRPFAEIFKNLQSLLKRVKGI
jgi:hypothetical protein